MKIAALRLLQGLLALLPLPLVRSLGSLFGRLPLGGRRRRVLANLAIAFPELDDRARGRLARRHRQAMMTNVLEVGPLWGRSRAWLEAHFDPPENRACVDAALSAGRGLLLAGGHLGHSEAGVLWGTMNLPITYLYKPPGDPALDRALVDQRRRFGGEFIHTGTIGMRRALRALRAGRAVSLSFDQRPKDGEFVEAPFFGRDVATMTLAWRLARSTGCAVVLGHVVRTGSGWQARFQELDGLAEEADATVAAARMNAALETEIRRAPEQYLWRYPRFEPVMRRDSKRGPGDAARPR